MGFSIPNEADAAFAPQARPNSTDIAALTAGLAGNGVISGCAVTAQGTPDMTVAVAAGVILDASGGTFTVTAGNVTITTANATNPRIDLIVTVGPGGNSALAGTAAANPVMPAYDPDTDGVVLAAVYVPANDTAIATNQIIDKRVMLPAPVSTDPIADKFGAPDTAFEFATSSLTGLTAIGTPTAEDADTTFPGYYYLLNDTNAAPYYRGRGVGGTAPFTAICKMVTNANQNYEQAGLLVAPSTFPGSGAFRVLTWGYGSVPNAVSVEAWASNSSYSSTPAVAATGLPTGPLYLAIVVHSASDVDFCWSPDGFLWRAILVAHDPSFTGAFVGLVSGAQNTDGFSTIFDYLRIWTSALTFPGV